MKTIAVPFEAPEEVAALLLQAASDNMIESIEDAKSVWRELVSVAGIATKALFDENMARKEKE